MSTKRSSRVATAAIASLFAAVLFWFAGCSKYPEVQDGRSVELIAALRTACSSQNPDRLQRCEQAIKERRAAGDLPDAEYEAFQAIIAKARAGEWEEAEMETYEFQEAQVR